MAIEYVDGKRLCRTLDAGFSRVLAREEYLNRINVFPVPDADTGTNLVYTLTAVRRGIANCASASISDVSRRLADAALDGARGNSGAILAQFLVGFAEAVHDQVSLTTRQFSTAVQSASHYAYQALLEPRDGTILSVIRDWSDDIVAQSERFHDFNALLHNALQQAKRSLRATPDQLVVLKEAGVVDAGAQGFVFLLEGVQEFICHGKITPAPEDSPSLPAIPGVAVRAAEESFRYCNECVVTGSGLDRGWLQLQLAEHGNSLVLAGTADKLKVHIHTNDPQAVVRICAQLGQVSKHKIDDMQRQQNDLQQMAAGMAIVMDSACDLPAELIEKYSIHVIPIRLGFGDETFLDGVEMTAETFWDRAASCPLHPKTSQPSPGEFLRLYRQLSTRYRSILSIHIPAGASGTLQSALTASRRLETAEAHPLDTNNFSVGAGLVALSSAEALSAGHSPDKVRQIAAQAALNTELYVGLDTLEFAVRGGRVSAAKKKVAEVLRANPILTVNPSGKIEVAGKTFGNQDKTLKLVRWVLKRLSAGKSYRFGIAYTTDRDQAEAAAAMLQELTGTELVLITRVGPALGVHAGPGALAVAVQAIEDN